MAHFDSGQVLSSIPLWLHRFCLKHVLPNSIILSIASLMVSNFTQIRFLWARLLVSNRTLKRI